MRTILPLVLLLAPLARAAEVPNPFETAPPWTSTQVEVLLGRCRKPTLKELRGRWLQAALVSPETNALVSDGEVNMVVMRNPDGEDDNDYIALIEAPQALDAAQKQAKGGGKAVDANMRFRVDMERLKDAADIMHTLVRTGVRVENQCKLSPKGYLLCRGVQAQAGSEPTITYVGFVRARPKAKR